MDLMTKLIPLVISDQLMETRYYCFVGNLYRGTLDPTNKERDEHKLSNMKSKLIPGLIISRAGFCLKNHVVLNPQNPCSTSYPCLRGATA